MTQKEKEELQKFTKLAAEGCGFLIPLHYPFLLPGQVLARELPYLAGLEWTERWRRELRGGDESQQSKFDADQSEARQITRTLLNLIKGSLSAGAASKALKDAGPRGKAWTHLPEQITAKLRKAPDVRESLETLLQFGELRFAALDKQVKAGELLLDSLTTLGRAALDQGDDFATERLIDIANYAVTILEALGEQRPELVRPHARKSFQWPVMATVEPNGQAHIQEKLQLGEDTIHGKFNKAKAYNLEIVSRRYARGIVETLEKNRCCAALVKERMAVIKTKEKQDGIKVFVNRIPAWVGRATKLDPFGPNSADAWLDVGIEMLKEQRPHLPNSPEWKRIKAHWENRSSDTPTPGRMWNSIKDALRSPIKTIARAHKTEKPTQKLGANLGNPNSDANKA